VNGGSGADRRGEIWGWGGGARETIIPLFHYSLTKTINLYL
jgi:hypothetical protein